MTLSQYMLYRTEKESHGWSVESVPMTTNVELDVKIIPISSKMPMTAQRL